MWITLHERVRHMDGRMEKGDPITYQVAHIALVREDSDGGCILYTLGLMQHIWESHNAVLKIGDFYQGE